MSSSNQKVVGSNPPHPWLHIEQGTGLAKKHVNEAFSDLLDSA